MSIVKFPPMLTSSVEDSRNKKNIPKRPGLAVNDLNNISESIWNWCYKKMVISSATLHEGFRSLSICLLLFYLRFIYFCYNLKS